MIVDLVLAIVAGWSAQSFWVFLVLLVVGAMLTRPERPWSSGLIKLALIMLGISMFFGGGDDCDV